MSSRNTRHARHKVRELALNALYAHDFLGCLGLGDGIPVYFPAMSEAEEAALPLEVRAAVQLIVTGTLEHIEAIDACISNFSPHRSIARIQPVDRAILRLSLFSMLYQKDVPSEVLIDEAVKLSLEYSSNVNYKYINGLLDTIRKEFL